VVWLQHPDLRFGQLIDNLYSSVPETPMVGGRIDIFIVEDTVLELALDRVLEKGFG
jgi:hypothetical protein